MSYNTIRNTHTLLISIIVRAVLYVKLQEKHVTLTILEVIGYFTIEQQQQ